MQNRARDSPVSTSKKKSVRLTTLLVAWHCAWPPPPGSCPKIAYFPSQVNEAEWPMVTPAGISM